MTLDAFKQTEFYRRSYFDARFDSVPCPHYAFIANQFDRWLNAHPKTERSVPHIVHQLWVGSPFPEKYRDWAESWKTLNPGWEYRLWNEENLHELFSEAEMKWFTECRNFGPKSDLFRYAALYKFGGIYCDTDFECLQNMDEIADSCTLAVGNQVAGKIELGSAFVASAKGHPLMKKLAQELLRVNVSTDDTEEIIRLTGPGFLTEQFFAAKDTLLPTDVLFPTNYFYPFPNTERDKHYTKRQLQKKYFRPYSVAVHYWEVSWEKRNFIWYAKKIVKTVILYKYWKKFLRK